MPRSPHEPAAGVAYQFGTNMANGEVRAWTPAESSRLFVVKTTKDVPYFPFGSE
jgi:hypothetical protein